jgi:hypothetical protein
VEKQGGLLHGGGHRPVWLIGEGMEKRLLVRLVGSVLMFRMQLHKHTELSMLHFTESILQVSYLYFPKGERIAIMSKTNTGSNSNKYY